MAITNEAPTPTTAHGICIAFLDSWDVTNASSGPRVATWTRLDDPSVASLAIGGGLVTSPSHTVVSWSVDRGRQYELDTTQTGTASIQIVDTTGLFDPTGTSPYAAALGSMKRAVINVQNPFTGNYQDIFSGYVSSYTWSYADQSKKVMLIDISLVDGFDVLNRAELVPDNTGYTNFVGEVVVDRINTCLFSANWPGMGNTDSLTSINTGNVAVIGYQYNSGTSILSAIQDAADAEFPGVANFYMDRHGNATFRGRWPRFIPELYGNQVSFWNVGDYNYAMTYGYVPINDMQFTIDQTLLYNASLCYPYNTPQFNYPNQFDFDPTSIASYGVRQITLNDLLCGGAIAESDSQFVPDNTYGATTGAEECLNYAHYYVANFAQPVLRISQLTFKSVDPGGGTPNEAFWAFICNVEIGDVLNVYSTIPGSGGLNPTTTILGDVFQGNQYFVDGIHHQVNPLSESYPDWTMTLDLSPRVWYSTFKNNTYYPA